MEQDNRTSLVFTIKTNAPRETLEEVLRLLNPDLGKEILDYHIVWVTEQLLGKTRGTGGTRQEIGCDWREPFDGGMTISKA